MRAMITIIISVITLMSAHHYAEAQSIDFPAGGTLLVLAFATFVVVGMLMQLAEASLGTFRHIVATGAWKFFALFTLVAVFGYWAKSQQKIFGDSQTALFTTIAFYCAVALGAMLWHNAKRNS